MKKSWLKTLLTKISRNALNQEVNELRKQLAHTQHLLNNSKCSESKLSARIGRLRNEQPAIHEQYFSKKGAAQ